MPERTIIREERKYSISNCVLTAEKKAYTIKDNPFGPALVKKESLSKVRKDHWKKLENAVGFSVGTSLPSREAPDAARLDVVVQVTVTSRGREIKTIVPVKAPVPKPDPPVGKTIINLSSRIQLNESAAVSVKELMKTKDGPKRLKKALRDKAEHWMPSESLAKALRM